MGFVRVVEIVGVVLSDVCDAVCVVGAGLWVVCWGHSGFVGLWAVGCGLWAVGCVGCGEVEFSRLVLSSPSCVKDGHHLVRATSSRRRTAHAT